MVPKQFGRYSFRLVAFLVALTHPAIAPLLVTASPDASLLVSQQSLANRTSADTLPSSVADAVRQSIAQQTGRSPDRLQIVDAETRTWSDGCLGLADEDELCTLSLVPGWLVAVEGDGQRWIYRTNDLGSIVRQQSTGRIQTEQGWKLVTQVVRLLDESGDVSQLAILTDVIRKPQTRYANAVYQLYAYYENEWVQVYNTTGSRLISSDEIGQSLPPELIEIEAIRDVLGSDVDLQRLNLKAVIQLRYDTQEQRDQDISVEYLTQYRGLGTFNSIQLTQFRTVILKAMRLRIVQGQHSATPVIARLSLQQRASNQLQSEQFIGDFQTDVDQSIQLVDGLTPGDRLIVRLFDLEQQLIGYSAIEVQAQATDITLVLSENREQGIVRTVYGRDANGDRTLSTDEIQYDYFTRISEVSRTYRRTEVQFLETTETVSVRDFTIAGLPEPSTNCIYPVSFRAGAFEVVNRTFGVIQSNIAEFFTTSPQILAQVVTVSATTIIHIYQSIAIHTVEPGEPDSEQSPNHPPARTNVTIEKMTNGQDADRPRRAVAVAVGDPIEWVYSVTNQGRDALPFDDISVSDNQGITPVLDSTSDVGGDRLLSPGETWQYRATGMAEDLSILLDFETDGRGNSLQAGIQVDDEYANLGLRVSTPVNQFGAMLFDSENPTGGDNDLRTSDQGLILIISEDGNSSDPDDEAQGGILRFEWQRPVRVNYALGVIDADDNETAGTVMTYSANGRLIDVYEIRGIGNQSFQRIPINDRNVARMDIELVGSGAITGVSVDQVYQNIGSVDVNGDRVSDRSHYRND
ncbi:MAG: hypothetical protein AAF327_03635 [Cyanobacteria bacterium P01_A01_bin.37]